MIQGHGDDGYQYETEIIADFSSNVWCGGEPKGLKEHIFENWRKINHYPEVVAESLGKKIAVHHQVAAGNILVTNGTTESIYLTAQLFSGNTTTILTPSFSEYEDACSVFSHDLAFLNWSEALTLPLLRTELIFVCNPNNPTGNAFTGLENWIRINPSCIFVVDEAFIDFTMGIESAISLISRYGNVIVLRSLTKAYSIPGLRLGYIAASEELIQALLRVKQPWSVNVAALLAGEFIFDNITQAQLPLAQLLWERAWFTDQLQHNDSIEVGSGSYAHFFLCATRVRNASQLKQFLVDNHGLLIRDAGNFRNLTRQHFRIATRSHDSNILLINALEEWKKLYF